MLIRVLFLSLIKVKGEHFAVKIDRLCFTLRFAEGCLIVCVLFLSLVKENGEDFRCEKTLPFFSQNQLALLESRPSAGFLVGLRWNKPDILA